MSDKIFWSSVREADYKGEFIGYDIIGSQGDAETLLNMLDGKGQFRLRLRFGRESQKPYIEVLDPAKIQDKPKSQPQQRREEPPVEDDDSESLPF